MNLRLYSRTLVFLLLIETIALLLTCMYLDPVVGDTTRLSGYSENDFGWNIPQKTFELPADALKENYEEYSDVLVVGDSFSFGGVLGMMNYPWQTYLKTMTGFTVQTISHYTTVTNPPSYDPKMIPSIVNSPAYKNNPPKIFILEVVERQLHIVPKIQGDCKTIDNRVTLDFTFKPQNEAIPNIEKFRSKKYPPLLEQYSFAIKYWETLLYLNAGDNQAFVFNLMNDKLFSNRLNGKLLVYEGDVKKKNWDEGLLKDIQCRFINIKNMVQANGKTLFILMIAPDKLTAYSPYLKDRNVAKYTVIDKIAESNDLNIPRFDHALQEIIEKGNIDVYLPNDTHWASKGQEIAAKTIYNFLMQKSNNN